MRQARRGGGGGEREQEWGRCVTTQYKLLVSRPTPNVCLYVKVTARGDHTRPLARPSPSSGPPPSLRPLSLPPPPRRPLPPSLPLPPTRRETQQQEKRSGRKTILFVLSSSHVAPDSRRCFVQVSQTKRNSIGNICNISTRVGGEGEGREGRGNPGGRGFMREAPPTPAVTLL